jgi:WD40 repeat protein
MAFDDHLAPIPTIEYDTSLVILAMTWSPKARTLYLAGNFGWVRAIRLDSHVAVTGTTATWVPLWTNHDTGQWTCGLAIDELRNVVFEGSGKEIYMWGAKTGQKLLRFDSLNVTELYYSEEHLLLLLTCSTDGTIKTWRIFDRHATVLQVIGHAPLGPTMIQLDGDTLVTMSHERILRRYSQ